MPFLAPRQEEYVRDAMQRGELMRGAYLDRLEEALSRQCGGYAVCVSSGTAGLFLAMEASRRPVYRMPALTYLAPAQAARLWGAWPLFVDIYPVTWGAAVPVDVQVHLYGMIAPGTAPIDDACEALGAWTLRGRFGVLSFNQNKLATGGGGGAVLCAAKYEADRMRHLIRGARVPGAPHIWDALGWPFEMSNLQAAVMCAQLEMLTQTIARKQQLAWRYAMELPEIPWQPSITYWQPVGLLPVPAGPVVAACQAAGVEARHVWPCLPDLPLFADCRRDGDFPVARHVAEYGISLPCSVDLTESEQATVIATVRRALAGSFATSSSTRSPASRCTAGTAGRCCRCSAARTRATAWRRVTGGVKVWTSFGAHPKSTVRLMSGTACSMPRRWPLSRAPGATPSSGAGTCTRSLRPEAGSPGSSATVSGRWLTWSWRGPRSTSRARFSSPSATSNLETATPLRSQCG